MLGKWVRFDNKIPVDGISWAQGFPIPKILGYKRNVYRNHPNPASRKTAPSPESEKCAEMTIP